MDITDNLCLTSDALCLTIMFLQHNAWGDKLSTAQACLTLNPQTFFYKLLRSNFFFITTQADSTWWQVPLGKNCEALKFDFTCRECVCTEALTLLPIFGKCVYMHNSSPWPWGIWPLALRIIQACTWTVWYAQGHVNSFCSHLWLPVSPCLPHESQQQAAVKSFPCENWLACQKSHSFLGGNKWWGKNDFGQMQN